MPRKGCCRVEKLRPPGGDMAASNRCRVSSHSRAPRWGASIAAMSWALTCRAKTSDQRWMEGLPVRQKGVRFQGLFFHFRPASTSANVRRKAETLSNGPRALRSPQVQGISLLDLNFSFTYIHLYYDTMLLCYFHTVNNTYIDRDRYTVYEYMQICKNVNMIKYLYTYKCTCIHLQPPKSVFLVMTTTTK